MVKKEKESFSKPNSQIVITLPYEKNKIISLNLIYINNILHKIKTYIKNPIQLPQISEYIYKIHITGILCTIGVMIVIDGMQKKRMENIPFFGIDWIKETKIMKTKKIQNKNRENIRRLAYEEMNR
jgi:hypothetical protein